MGHIYQRGRIYWIKYHRDGRPFYESSGSGKEGDAKRLLRLREGDIERSVQVTPRMNKAILGELAEDVFNDYRKNKYKTLPHIQGRFTKHILPFFGEHKRASNITTSRINEFIVHRQKEGVSNAEINRELSALKRAFTLAVQSEPPKLMRKPHIKLLVEDNVRQGFFERDQFEAVRRHLREYLRPFVTFSYITGWRKSEIKNLQWPQVDFENEWVILEVGTTKNKDARQFPFTDELRELLRQQQESNESLKKSGIICPWVFHRNQGKPVGDFRKSWKTACKKAGLPGKIPHDFRRTAVRNLVRAGIPESVAMKMTGHKTRSVFDRYDITSEKDLREAAQLLNAVVTI